MALTVIATPGAANANSYCTVAEADTYHEGHLYADTWTGASAAQKAQAVVMATRLLDERYAWASWPAAATQALQWPRSGVMDALYLSVIDSSTVPSKLKQAAAELARQLLDGDRTADNQVETQGVQSMTAGPVSFSFKDSVKAKVVPDAVRNMIPHWWGRLRSSGEILDVKRG